MDCFKIAVYMAVITAIAAKRVVLDKKIGKNTNFSWSNCNNTVDPPLWFKSISLTPDVVQFDTPSTISVAVDLFTDVVAHVEASISIRTHGGKTDFCDLLHICHVDDVCEYLKKEFKDKGKDKCPSSMKKKGSNCMCPFKKNAYSVKDAKFTLASLPFEVHGNFTSQIRLKIQGKELGCIEMNFCISKC